MAESLSSEVSNGHIFSDREKKTVYVADTTGIVGSRVSETKTNAVVRMILIATL